MSAADAFADGIDRTDPNFVKASLLVMSPGDELYSCAGHSCLRPECPTFNLDCRFSDDLTFPTAEWLKLGRVNLPPDAKQRLWKLLDGKVSEDPYLPFRNVFSHLEHICREAA